MTTHSPFFCPCLPAVYNLVYWLFTTCLFFFCHFFCRNKFNYYFCSINNKNLEVSMSKGKSICSVLKTIRKQVADANGIKYEPRVCHYQGECLGTCPACEAEVRYLEQQLDMRRQLGKAVAIIGISAGLAALTGCNNKVKPENKIDEGQDSLSHCKSVIDTMEHVDGDVAYRSPVDSVIIKKDPATIKKRTAPFEAPASQTTTEMKDSAIVEEEHVLRVGEVVVDECPPQPDLNKVFGIVEQMPMFRGGDAALMTFLDENIRYPSECMLKGIEGRVVVTFIVERDGTITNAKVIKSVHPLLDKEALRVVESMPKWFPGKENGISRRVGFTLPVRFRLNE